MGDLRSSFLSRDFIINANVIKCISNLDLSLDEFLLLVYFMNVSVDLDSDSIMDKLGFDEKKISDLFSSLLSKKYIDMNVSKVDGKIHERINLNPFYDRLVLNKKTDDNSSDIYALFERELGRTLSSFEYELINKWIENGISENIIKEALKEAILNGVTNFNYIDKIVYDWSRNGIKKRIKEEKSLEEMFDYDWLSDNE